MTWPTRSALLLCAVVGLLAAVAVESLAAAGQSAAERRLLGGWLTVTVAPARLAHLPATPAAVVIAATVLVLSWLWIAVGAMRTRVRPAVVLGLSALWSAPFLIGVPILSRDCYAYLAQGEVMRRGWDPYVQTVGRLGSHDRLAAAVDPLWQSSVPPYGPVALRLSAFAAWAGHELGHPQVGLLVLRALAVGGIALAVACVYALAPVGRGSAAIWLMMSPLTLLQLIGAVHMEGILVGLLAAAVLAMRRDRAVLSLTFIVAAACIKITALSALAVLVIHTWQHADPIRRLRRAVGLATAGLLALPVAMAAAGGADAWGWLRGLSTPASVWDPLTPANELLLALGHVASWSGVPVPSGLAFGLRVAVGAVGIAVAVVIVRTAPRRDACLTGAYLVADLAACGPVLWPWYLAPVIVLLLASGSARGRLYAAICGASSALWVLPIHVVEMQRVAFAAQAGAALAFAGWALLRSRGRRRPGEASTYAGPPLLAESA